ncbi:MAG TPA: peptide chain release factor-like protein [Dehalococcoidia bacterium]|nr:peptide chain release factor-like protein [Dehalococcoidia bacterium]
MADATWQDFLPLDDAALLAQCEFDRFRASGPGGQKRNVTESAVRLRHGASGLTSEATESRSQHENRARALRRLRIAIALTLRAPIVPQAHAASDELAAALGPGLGRRDARFWPAVAALLDVLEHFEWKLSSAAKLLGVTTASVSRVLESDVVVLRAANERRRALELKPLRVSKQRGSRRR